MKRKWSRIFTMVAQLIGAGAVGYETGGNLTSVATAIGVAIVQVIINEKAHVSTPEGDKITKTTFGEVITRKSQEPVSVLQ